MSKFQKGDRVRCVSNDSERGQARYMPGDFGTIQDDFSPHGVIWDNGQECCALDEEIEPATPTEHPALTLAKAEVVRLTVEPHRTTSQAGMLSAFERILYAFGLEYRAKPVVPQPVEYEFLPVQDAG